ncbi:MAG: class IV adenylate cyclase [Phycisphaerae bacterium]
MIEIEAKIQVDDLDLVRQRLKESGAGFIGCYAQSNHILDRPDGSLRKQGCGLRVRTVKTIQGREAPATLTFKGPAQESSVKRREEIQLDITDADKLLQVLEAIGFETVLTYAKRRESWSLERCRVELDEVPLLGTFVEIEGPSERDIHSVRQRVELADETHIERSYVGMLWDRCRELGRSTIGIDFVEHSEERD